MTNADPTATDLRRSLETCPACAGNLDDHSYARFAVTVATDENNERLERFCHALKARDWIALKPFDDFDPLRNALEATVLRCASGVLVMLAVRDPFELFDSTVVLGYDVLDQVNGDALGSLIASDQWRSLSLTNAA